MKLSTRNKQIFKLRDKGFSLQEIGTQLNLSSERIRQIIEEKDSQYCQRHKVFFKTICRFCNIKENYIQKIKQIAQSNLMDEIVRLSKPNRQKEVVLQRQALIKLLKDDYKFNFLEIADLLERDHTSVVHLYHKKPTI